LDGIKKRAYAPNSAKPVYLTQTILDLYHKSKKLHMI